MRKHRGRPTKRAKRNITGLKNQSRQQSLSNTSDNSRGDYSDSSGLDLTELDCLAYLEVDSDHSDDDNEADWDEVAQEEFQDRLFQLIAQIEEDRRDAGDTDWVPSRTAYEAEWAAKRRKPGGRPTEYIKGPDVFLSIPSSSSSSAPSSSALPVQDSSPHHSGDEGPPPTETSNSTPFSTESRALTNLMFLLERMMEQKSWSWME
ncbi:hypothetical protein B0H13DRAFT_1872784 [Mycena leptocephala]|nr:hypothetical protein B0H13DRAFT_1872784 [Mycena leptocephala]